MSYRKGILILEHDDFLREILGNLLHKQGYYIVTDFHAKKAIEKAQKHPIHFILLGESCELYKGKQTIHYLQEKFSLRKNKIYLLKKKKERAETEIFSIENLSIREIIHTINKLIA